MEKLVRDRIPAVIAASGQHARLRRADPGEMISLLLRKLHEEVDEVAGSGQSDPEELADVLEALRALAGARGFAWADVEAVCATKRSERGGFAEGWVLDS